MYRNSDFGLNLNFHIWISIYLFIYFLHNLDIGINMKHQGKVTLSGFGLFDKVTSACSQTELV